MLLENKKTAIIGAGPVGLTMASLLQQSGFDVTVYERDKDAQKRIWGGTLDLHKGSGQDAMHKAGLLQNYYETAKPMGRIITDNQTKVLFRKDAKPEERYDNPEINRNDLRKLLLNNLKPGTVVWDKKFMSLEEQNGKWLIHFDHETKAAADFVIGANGGMSQARKYITDEVAAYTGTYIIQGEVTEPEIKCPEFFQLCEHHILMTAYKGLNLVANPDNNGALTYNVTFRKSEEWMNNNDLNFQHPENIAAFLAKMFADWHECYKKLFYATSFFTGLPTRQISLNKAWKNDRPLPITLIGDAAHIMPPFAGEGVNTGLKDALILAENLTNGKFKSIETAISDYEQKMFVYAAAAQLQTSKNEIAMHEHDFSFQKRFNG